MVFREVIRPPIWLLSFIYFMFLSLVVAIWAALDNRSAFISWLVFTLGIFFIAFRWRTEISLNEQELRVGTAHIELKYLKGATALNHAVAQNQECRPSSLPFASFLDTDRSKN
jgi:hypothetical protein